MIDIHLIEVSIVIVGYAALGYVVGIPVGILGDYIFGRNVDISFDPMPVYLCVLGWPAIFLLVAMGFPLWLLNKRRSPVKTSAVKHCPTCTCGME